MAIRNKRTRLSWLLLLVYIPMLLAVTFHHHGEARPAVDVSYCEDCAHHVHHHGHLLALQDTTHDCVLCQLQSTFYLAPALLLWTPCVVLRRATRLAACAHCQGKENGVRSTRAPPCF